jgi:hypothetical protein
MEVLELTMSHDTTWELPFSQSAELELHTEWGQIVLIPVGPGETPRLELTRGSADNVVVHIDKQGDVVRVGIDPQRSFNWFGGWECRAAVYVPHDVRAHVQTNAGSVSVRDLANCELGIKANAGKIELDNVHGLLHLAADAGSVTGRAVGGSFDVETQAGSIKLEIDDLQPTEHRIRATMGSVRLDLARGLDVSVETHTSLGSVRNGYPSRDSAPTRLILTTEMGSVRVDEGRADRPQRPERPVRPERSERSAAPREDPELERILKMVEAGELSAHDADELLRAMGRV